MQTLNFPSAGKDAVLSDQLAPWSITLPSMDHRPLSQRCRLKR